MTTTKVTDPIREVREYWDLAAPTYDARRGHGLFEEVEREAWTRLLLRLLPPAPARVLDVGTGTGFLAFRAAELGHAVVGVDAAPSMLRIAATGAAAAGLDVRFELGCADLEELPPGRFDAVISRHLVWTLPLPERTIAFWRDRVEPGGLVAAIDGVWFGGGPVQRVRAACGRALGRLSGTERERGTSLYTERGAEAFPLKAVRNLDPARNAFVRAGLTRVRAEYLDGIDALERRTMPLAERLESVWRRYLVEGEA